MSEALVVDGLEDLRARVGQTLATEDWETLGFDQILAFADATGDHQWIHVDCERAARESPFGAPVAHGYWTLSRIGGRFAELVSVRGVRLTVNYGLERVRFPAPLRVGARHRLRVELLEVSEVRGGAQAHYRVTAEVEGEAKPAMVAEPLFRYYL